MEILSLPELTTLFHKKIEEMHSETCDIKSGLNTERLMEIIERFYEIYKRDLSWFYYMEYFGINPKRGVEISYPTNGSERMVVMLVIDEVYRAEIEEWRSYRDRIN